jgi:propanol-preferring alcohol dehydrogenase
LGTLVCIGLANEHLPISPFQMIIRGISVAGSSVGTKQELKELMEMAVNGKVRPIVRVYDFERLDTVLQMLKDNVVGGRFVVMLPE